jgi:endonuclease-8
VLELTRRAVRRLGPDILAEPTDLARMVENLRREHPGRQVGDALLDQRLVAGIGNLWKAEALWHARISPWRRLDSLTDDDLRSVLRLAHRLMKSSVEGARPERRAYRKKLCSRCGTRIQARGQGDANRIAYWCPTCQP